jgi:hypothetical protein
MDSLKSWLFEVGVKKMGPSAIRGAILGIFGWILAKQGALATFGIIADQATHTITIHLDQLNMVLIAGLPAVLAAAIKMFNHQANEVVLPIIAPSVVTPKPTNEPVQPS